MKTKCTIQRRKDRRMNDGGRRQTAREVGGKEDETQKVGVQRADLPSCVVQARKDTIVGAHFGCAGQRPKMDLCRVTRLVERTAVARARQMVRAARTFVSPKVDKHAALLGPSSHRS